MKTKLVIGILISCAFLFWAFRDVDFANFWLILKTARYRYFALAIAFSIIVYLIRTYRWKYLLILQKDIGFLSVFSAMCIGVLANIVLPFRAGEFLRAYVIGRSEQISKSAALATILVERIIDVLSLLFIALCAVFFLPIPENIHYEAIKYFGAILFTIEIVVIIFCFMLLYKRELTLKIFEKVFGIFSATIQTKGKNIIKSFLDGLEIMRSTRHFFKITVSTFAVWFFALAQLYSLLLAFEIHYNIVTMVMISTVDMVLISFALTIPSAPGFVGTYHAGAKEGLVIFSIDPNIASGFAVLAHVSSLMPVTVIGFYFFLRENIKFSMAQAEYRKEPESSNLKGTNGAQT